MTQRTCLQCGEPFNHGRSDKRYCSDTCRAKAAADDGTCLTCTVDGCSKSRRNRAATLCGMHYFRWRRGGSLERRHQPTGRGVSSGGYALVYQPDSPLAHADGWCFQHRVVLHEQIGPGQHRCYWCQMSVTWAETYPASPQALVVDHLDNDTLNNDPTNLVPSCGLCNWNRSAA